ncbi:MAG TPA: FGGY-family carbohydrate kinase [Clostridia bacterium]|nr:FGGY-family carbohydrate kinase [Clostridia bacterium]
MASYLLSHDIGTSASKATLFHYNGEISKSSTIAYEAEYSNGTWAEQDPRQWWDAFCQNNQTILEGIDPAEVAAVSISGQMMGCLPVDQDCKPLYSSIIWADGRSVQQAEELLKTIGNEEFFPITGMTISPNYGIEKAMWVKKHMPGIFGKTYKFLQSKDYITCRLCGEFVTEASDAQYMHCYDIKTGDWSGRVLRAAGIDRDKLPGLVKSGTLLGKVMPSIAQECGLSPCTAVVEGIGDGRASLLGTGVIELGDAYISLGTSSWVGMIVKAREPVYQPASHQAVVPFLNPDYIVDGGTMQAGGLSLNWLKKELCRYEQSLSEKGGAGVYQLIDSEVLKSSAGSNGVIFLPYLMGERDPWWNTEAKAAFLGLKAESSRADLYRSVLEGVAMNLAAILRMSGNLEEIKSMRITGGGAKSRVWRQIFADVLDMPIIKTNIGDEAGSLGTAVLAGIGIGLYRDYSVIQSFHKIEEITYPIPSNVSVYQKMQPVFEDSYRALTGINHRLSVIFS